MRAIRLLTNIPYGQLAGYLAHLSVFSREYDFAQGKLSFLTHYTFDLKAKEFPTAWVNIFDLLGQDPQDFEIRIKSPFITVKIGISF